MKNHVDYFGYLKSLQHLQCWRRQVATESWVDHDYLTVASKLHLLIDRKVPENIFGFIVLKMRILWVDILGLKRTYTISQQIARVFLSLRKLANIFKINLVMGEKWHEISMTIGSLESGLMLPSKDIQKTHIDHVAKFGWLIRLASLFFARIQSLALQSLVNIFQ